MFIEVRPIGEGNAIGAQQMLFLAPCGPTRSAQAATTGDGTRIFLAKCLASGKMESTSR